MGNLAGQSLAHFDRGVGSQENISLARSGRIFRHCPVHLRIFVLGQKIQHLGLYVGTVCQRGARLGIRIAGESSGFLVA
jgi:hypothetical protein